MGFLRRRGRLQGTVRNLRREGGVANFWLEVSGKTGEHVPVEAYVGQGVVEEGDMVWVEGRTGSDGILRTSKFHNVSRGMPAAGGFPAVEERMKRQGKTEFSGIVVGDVYDLDHKFSAVTGQDKFKVGRKIQRFDADGNPLDTLEIVLDQKDNFMTMHPNDSVWIRGKWRKDGRVQVLEARNITTRAIIKRRKRGWKKIVVLLISLFILYIIFLTLLEIGNLLSSL